MGVEESYERDRRYFYDSAANDYQCHVTYADDWGNIRINVVHYGPVPPPHFPKGGQVGNFPGYMNSQRGSLPKTIRQTNSSYQPPTSTVYEVPSNIPTLYNTMYDPLKTRDATSSPSNEKEPTSLNNPHLITLSSKPPQSPTQPGTGSPKVITPIQLPIQPLPPVYPLPQVQTQSTRPAWNAESLYPTHNPYLQTSTASRSPNASVSPSSIPTSIPVKQQNVVYPQFKIPIMTNFTPVEIPHATPVAPKKTVSEQVKHEVEQQQIERDKAEYKKRQEAEQREREMMLKERERLQQLSLQQEQQERQRSEAMRLEAERLQRERIEKMKEERARAEQKAIEEKVAAENRATERKTETEEPFILQRAVTIKNQPQPVPVQPSIVDQRRFNPLAFTTPEVKGFEGHDDL